MSSRRPDSVTVDDITITHDQGALSIFEPATGRIIDVNDAWVKLYGWSREEARAMKVTDVSAEPDATRAAIGRATDVGGAHIEVRWHKHRDGRVFPVDLAAGLLRAGERPLMFAVMHDITQRFEAAQKLRRSEESFRTLIELMPAGVIVHREGVVLYVNPAARRIFGHDEDPAGRPVLDIVAPEDHDVVSVRLAHPAASQPALAVPHEQRMLRANGEVFWAEIVSLPTVFDGGSADLTIVHDLTERKRMEAQLVTNDRLASLGRLAASVGHEINNPLAYVLGSVELLQRALPRIEGPAALRSEIEQRVAAIEDGATRVRDIVRDLKTLSRDGTELRGRVDVNKIVDVCLKIADSELRARARVVRDYGVQVVAHANEGRLGQVFLNLLVNAAQALEGEGDENEVRVRTRVVGERVVVEVSDTGSGIPAHIVDRIYEPFFTTKSPGAGTGLGLSISHHIVTELGGTIEVESNTPRGTRFRVSVPAAAQD